MMHKAKHGSHSHTETDEIKVENMGRVVYTSATTVPFVSGCAQPDGSKCHNFQLGEAAWLHAHNRAFRKPLPDAHAPQ